ncbi:MAG: hypothetical protein V1817_01685 [Candidatus Micrarchaeota archaeon]
MIEAQFAGFVSAVFASGEALALKYGATVLFLTLGVAFYAAVFGTLYTYLSRRVLYEIKPEARGGISGFVSRFGNIVGVILQYTLLFPAITFLWFVLLSASLFILSRTAELETVFMLSISVVAAVRILAYYKEAIAVDLAKLLPLALLAVLIVEPGLFSVELVKSRLLELVAALPQFAAVIVFVVVLEWALRLLYILAKYLRNEPAKPVPIKK